MTTQPAKKTPAKKAAPKPAPKTPNASGPKTENPKLEATTPVAPSPIDPKAKQAGEALLALLDKAGSTKSQLGDTAAAQKLATKLSKGSATNADLIALRESINTISAALREVKEGALAAKFSDANRNV